MLWSWVDSSEVLAIEEEYVEDVEHTVMIREESAGSVVGCVCFTVSMAVFVELVGSYVSV
jgi:hypothetical protein